LKYRLFAAVELPPDLQAHLAEVQAGFAARLPQRSVRWVKPDTIHLTLKFYGDVRRERLPDFEAGLERAVHAAGAGAAAAPLTLRGLGVFPNPARPQVIWVGLEGDLSGMHRLQQAIEAEAETLGYPPDDRPFTPHLTLGRVRAGLHWADQQLLLDDLRRAQLDALGELRPSALSLMSSERKPAGAVYTTLLHWTLEPKENASGTA
jgi:2'-5' RNA ligase